MKKLLLILAAILILPIQTAFASSLPVTDSSLQDLVDRFNRVIADEDFANSVKFVGIEEGDGLKIHVYKRADSKINFAMNQDGKIDHITLVFQRDSEEASTISGESMGILLALIGVSSDEVDQLLVDAGESANVWCSATNRRIVIEGSDDNSGFCFMTIAAEDR